MGLDAEVTKLFQLDEEPSHMGENSAGVGSHREQLIGE